MSKEAQDLTPFMGDGGVLCYVVIRKHKGKGPLRVLLHEAESTNPGGFGYGHKRYWVLHPGSLLGAAASKAKSEAARVNGRLGGRPKKKQSLDRRRGKS